VTGPTVALGPFALRPAPAVCLSLALLLDAAVGEPPASVHPVALFGAAIDRLDRAWPFPRIVGVAVAAVAPLSVAAVSWWAVMSVPSPFAPVLAGLLLFSAISLRRLLDRAREVIDATDGDLERARRAVPALVGREPDALSAGQLRSAAGESLAENLADGFVAPLSAFVIGATVSLPVGVAAAVWLKAVNTLDSMLGYRGRPIGWASARLDDLLMWVPARLTAALIAAAARDLGALRRAREWRDAPPSPNSGWPMATLAVVLDARLQKPGVYDLHADAALPDRASADRGVRIVAIAGVLAGLVSIVAVSVRVVPAAAFVPGVAAC